MSSKKPLSELPLTSVAKRYWSGKVFAEERHKERVLERAQEIARDYGDEVVLSRYYLQRAMKETKGGTK